MVVAGLALAWALEGSAEVAEAGEPAPDFTVTLLDQGTFSLTDHLAEDGRPLIVNLWASWCAPCREEIPTLSEFASANPGIAVLGVAVEDVIADSKALVDELDPTYPMAFGDDRFADSYPNLGLPVTYFLDETGIVVEVYNGILTAETLLEKVPAQATS